MSKFQTIIKEGLEPYKAGKRNFEKPNAIAETLAQNRAKICNKCEFFKKEPNSFLRVEDKRIPEISEMMCGDCGCELPYKLRQSISICKKWE